MPLNIIRADISQLSVDAIVNPTDSLYSGSGGTDWQVHHRAGEELDAFCLGLEPLSPGEVYASPGFSLPARHIFHTVGPVWQGGGSGEEALLESCYSRALALALSMGCESIAFPIISAGSFGYPKDRALSTATRIIGSFLQEHELTVFLVVYNPEIFRLSESLYRDVKDYLSFYRPRIMSDYEPPMASISFDEPPESSYSRPVSAPLPKLSSNKAAAFSRPKKPDGLFEDLETLSLDQLLQHKEESFSQLLLRKIDERGMKDSQCYNRANIDRRVFSKIRSKPDYKPSKETAVAFAIALKMDMDETEQLLKSAGYALSCNNDFDIIVMYFITHRNYDIFELNNVLYGFKQHTLGSV